jgi:hypothetical protein
VISYIDIKKGLILDTIILPSFPVLVLIKYLDSSLVMEDLLSVALLLFIFVVPIALKMAFGGGDLRFGAFCSLFVGLEGVGYFILLSGLLHLLLLLILQKKSFAFAPAMSLAALGSFTIGVL